MSGTTNYLNIRVKYICPVCGRENEFSQRARIPEPANENGNTVFLDSVNSYGRDMIGAYCEDDDGGGGCGSELAIGYRLGVVSTKVAIVEVHKNHVDLVD